MFWNYGDNVNLTPLNGWEFFYSKSHPDLITVTLICSLVLLLLLLLFKMFKICQISIEERGQLFKRKLENPCNEEIN